MPHVTYQHFDIIKIYWHSSTLCGLRVPQSTLQVEYAAKPSKNKGGTKVTSMLRVTDNKPRLIPYSLRKGLQL